MNLLGNSIGRSIGILPSNWEAQTIDEIYGEEFFNKIYVPDLSIFSNIVEGLTHDGLEELSQ